MSKLATCLVIGGAVGLVAGPIVGMLNPLLTILWVTERQNFIFVASWMLLAGPTTGMLIGILMHGANRRHPLWSFALLMMVGFSVGALVSSMLPFIGNTWPVDQFFVFIFGPLSISTALTALICAGAIKLYLLRNEDIADRYWNRPFPKG